MKKNNPANLRFALLTAMLLALIGKGFCQTTMPEALTIGTMKEQMNYIEEHTRIYENYRAIREDMFQKTKANALDTLNKANKEILGLKNIGLVLNLRIDSLNSSLQSTRNKLDEITATKNSIKMFGAEVNKITYNSIMWVLITVLVIMLVFGFLAFKRNLVITAHTKKEFAELKDEFEEYRKTTREAREKMSLAHFNELKRLKGQ